VGATAIAALALCSTANAAKVKPIVDLSAAMEKAQATQQQAAQKPPPKRTGMPDERTLELGGGGLALLLLAGGAWAVTHRRRRANVWRGDYQSDEIQAVEPAAAPLKRSQEKPSAMANERSAFAWGNAPAAEPAMDSPKDDRRADETWVERAYQGPSPENPSMSLRKRLKRAAFFDKREREMASGKGAAVDADAGLPDRMTERAHEDEFETA